MDNREVVSGRSGSKVTNGHVVSCISLENPGSDRGPSGGRVQFGRDLRTSSLERIAVRHIEAPPKAPPDRVIESNNRHATCNGCQRDTNIPLPTYTPCRAWPAEREPHEAAVAAQFELRLERRIPSRPTAASRQAALSPLKFSCCLAPFHISTVTGCKLVARLMALRVINDVSAS